MSSREAQFERATGLSLEAATVPVLSPKAPGPAMPARSQRAELRGVVP